MKARIGFTGLTTAVLLAAVSGIASAQDTTRVAPDSLRDTTAVAPAPAVSDTTATDTAAAAVDTVAAAVDSTPPPPAAVVPPDSVVVVDRVLAVVGNRPVLASQVDEELFSRQAQGMKLPDDPEAPRRVAPRGGVVDR